eukprot:122877-Rhodomonas_salina.2
MACPVLAYSDTTLPSTLRTCYGMSGTDIRLQHYQDARFNEMIDQRSRTTPLSSYALSGWYTLSGTDLSYALALSGTELTYTPALVLTSAVLLRPAFVPLHMLLCALRYLPMLHCYGQDLYRCACCACLSAYQTRTPTAYLHPPTEYWSPPYAPNVLCYAMVLSYEIVLQHAEPAFGC